MSKNEENMQEHSGGKKRRNNKVIIGLAAGVCAVLLIGGLAARYITSNRQQEEATSAQFHVTSDYLEEEEATYQITDWGDGFNIQLYNYEKENLALVSEETISYEVTVEPASNWKVDSPNGELEGGSAKSKNLTITPIDKTAVKQNDEVTVTVKTTAPFTKTLSAKFTVASKNMPENQLIQSEDDKNQWHLIIGTNDYVGTVTVSWDKDKLCPDTTNEYMSSWMNNGSGNFEVKANTTYDLVFFSSQNGNTFKLSSASESGAAITIQ